MGREEENCHADRTISMCQVQYEAFASSSRAAFMHSTDSCPLLHSSFINIVGSLMSHVKYEF